MTATHMLPETHALAEQIGELVYSWGFKRIHGRLWTHLLLSKRPLDAADFVRLMDISKALVSITLRELMQFEVIQFAGKSARGTQLYQVNTNLKEVLTAILRRRERPALTKVRTSFERLAATPVDQRSESGLSNESIAQLGDWISRGGRMLDAFLRRDSQEPETTPGTEGERDGSESSNREGPDHHFRMA